ncbi:MAG TPA: nitroreductase family protein [Methanoregulaceae archaeon]|nr:MAG: nitroreductase family protein [Methanolinea sp.]HON81398.1 nitroreductase family protein [Methanoregulaceae archaeon]HPD10074.1 nitroreductase family protein [Methanoregulaceae archaeon]HRT15080.1 nitroreductase family protein [Methanoregulaceae archaeon]HRU30651.1 nitroreductase family protein [Methanoregulaceae archaeon]
MDSSEFFEFLAGRSSVREYGAGEIHDRELTFLLDCASTAPSAGNLEAWDVVLVRDQERREALSGAALGQFQVRAAPALFVLCANYVRSMSRYGERGILYAIQDATIAGTYLLLAAHALQLCSCWVGAFDEEETRSILGLPHHIRPIAIICIGRGTPPAELTGRMPVSEHLHNEVW